MKINSAGKLRSAAELRARERGYLHSWGQQAAHWWLQKDGTAMGLASEFSHRPQYADTGSRKFCLEGQAPETQLTEHSLEVWAIPAE